MGGREKQVREMAKKLRDAGCQVEPHPGRGHRWVVTTPNGERVVMAGLGGSKGDKNFLAHLRRLGVDI